MTENEHLTNEQDADVERSSEHIRQDIAHGEENLARTVDEIGARINAKLDWREYVRDSPYLAIGAAVGLGYLAARVFQPRRAAPLERIMDSLGGHVRNSLGGLIAGVVGPGLIKGAVLGIATRTAAGLIEHAIAASGSGGAGSGGAGSGGAGSSDAGTHADPGPRTET
jgi:ElaB/YqjD/DUF883 family membrane-anchored ribosome-binding protein